VESNRNDKAIGDNGKAFGIVQIHQSVIDDVNRMYRKTYKHSDAFDRGKSEEIFRLYLSYYCGDVTKAEQASRIWNGGPKGFKKESTKKYWKKVRKEYERVIKKGI
jgi:hypothetical protein